MIDVIRIPIPKAQLAAMPKEERALLLLLGYAANQINLLFKLVIFSSNKTPADQPEQILSGAQTQMLVRILIGVIHETYELIHKRFLGSAMNKQFSSKLDSAGQTALSNLKKYFGGSNLFSNLRNKHIFHHPSNDDMEAAFQAAGGDSQWDNDWNWFFSHSNYNSFYFTSEIVFMHGLLSAVGEKDLISAHKKIMDELREVSENIMHFIMALAAAFWKEYFGQEMVSDKVIKVDNASDFFEVWIPFFVEIESKKT